MKSRTLTCFTAMTLLAVLVAPLQLAAQHTRYRLVVIGTLGGPNSYDDINGFGDQILNNAGVVSSHADTSIPDPFGPLCFNADCFASHAFRWHKSVFTDLGALPGVSSSAAGAINARGWSVGQSQNGLMDPLTGSLETRAVLWKDDQIIDLGTLGGNESLAAYVNDAGQVVGVASNGIPDPFSIIFSGTETRAFLWDKGVMQDLGTLGGPDAIGDSGCRGNERNGLVAGSSYTNFTPNSTTGVPTLDPFLWENGTMTDLGTLGGVYGMAQCVNNRRQVVGQSSLAEHPGACLTSEPGCHAFLWQRGTMKDLGTLGGTFSVAFWLNDAGEAVGGATTANDELFHATLWRNGIITDLGTLDGDCSSVALAINSKGQILGISSNCKSNLQRAVLWDEGSIIDLNTVIPANSSLQLVEAFNINDRGEVVGWGALPGVQDPHFGKRLFLLIPCGDDEEGCEDSAVGTVPATQSDSGLVVNSPTTSVHRRPTPSEIVAAWRARMAQRYHIPGLVTISQITAGGAGFGFSGINPPVTLSSSQRATFYVSFRPHTSGSVTANLKISSNAPSASLSVPLSGSGSTRGKMAVSPSSINFGNVTIGTKKSQKGTVSAVNGPITVSAANVSGTEFSVSGISFPFTLSAGHTASYILTFAPTAGGSTSSTVTWHSNASNSPVHQYLTGFGTHKVTLTWRASISKHVVGYNIYRGKRSGGPYAKINTTLDTSTHDSDYNVRAGTTYYYVVTAVNSKGTQSVYSKQAKATIPYP